MTQFDHIADRIRGAPHRTVQISEQERAVLDNEVNAVIETIANARDGETADQSLRDLGYIQEVLSTLIFKHNIQLSERQRMLVRTYDRWDDRQTRLEVFEAIKAGRFLIRDREQGCRM